MKKIYSIIAACGLAVLGTACVEDGLNAGEGSISLNTSVNTDMKVVSRATDDQLAENCLIWISSEKGLVRKYQGMSQVPAQIKLVTGNYVAEAWTGDSVPASFEKRWFKGYQKFTVERGTSTPVNLVCKIANVAASVKYADNIEEVLTDITMTVGHSGGSLIFAGRDARRGYYMMSSRDKNLNYELRGMQANGKEFVFNGVIENAQPGTEYVLNVKYTRPTSTIGGAAFTIVVDSHEIEVQNSVTVLAPPAIQGHGFDISKPVNAPAGTLGRHTVYITSATRISAVSMESDYFATMPELGGTDINFMEMNQAGLDVLAAKGITYVNRYDEANDNHVVQINFEQEMLRALPNGAYAFNIEATNSHGKSSTAVLSFNISDAAVTTLAADGVTYTGATLRGEVSRDGITGLGFDYRAAGSSAWIHVNGVTSGAVTRGSVFTATITGLTPGQDYEFAATAGDFRSGVIGKFSTPGMEQLPNSGFEEWGKHGAANIFASNLADAFWDSGEHGATTLGDAYHVTMPESNIKHSGNYSAHMKSQKIVIKFAAGNLFAGRYLRTDGTNGELGFGRPFKSRPTAVRAWVKYNPVAVTTTSNKKISKGEMDKGCIYMALMDATTTPYSNSGAVTDDVKNSNWPVVVKTKTGEFFNKTAANVIGHGEYIFNEATAGDGLIQVTIPITYFRPDRPSYIIFVASSSLYGDYFEGGAGSEMYLDDIEMVYE